MADFEVVIGGDSADIPPGLYQGTLVSIETLTSDAFGEFRRWEFQLDGEGHRVSGGSSMLTGPKSKGGKWIAALLGRRPEKGEKVALAGKRATIKVIEDDKGWPKVDDVLPPMHEAAAGGQAATGTAVAATPSKAAAVPDDLPF